MDLHAVGEGERLELPEDQHTLARLLLGDEGRRGARGHGRGRVVRALQREATCTGAVNLRAHRLARGAFRTRGRPHRARARRRPASTTGATRPTRRSPSSSTASTRASSPSRCSSRAARARSPTRARVEVRARARARARGAWTTRELASYSLDGARSAAFRANCAAGHTAMMVGALCRCAAHGAAAQRWVFGAGGPGASGVGRCDRGAAADRAARPQGGRHPRARSRARSSHDSRVQDIARHIHPPTIRRLQRRFEEQDGGGFMESKRIPLAPILGI